MGLSTYAVPRQELWLPLKYPGETRDQAFDLTTLLPPIDVGEITALSVQVAPSGSGELALEAVALAGNVATIVEASGQGGRVYTFLFTATLSDGEVEQWVVKQCVGLLPPCAPPPPAPVPGFGAAVTWSYAPRLDFSAPRNSMYLL